MGNGRSLSLVHALDNARATRTAAVRADRNALVMKGPAAVERDVLVVAVRITTHTGPPTSAYHTCIQPRRYWPRIASSLRGGYDVKQPEIATLPGVDSTCTRVKGVRLS